MPEVAVAIPTYRRPASLAKLLAALEKLETTVRVVVIVADNDATDHAGYDLCRALCANYRWPLDPIIAEQRGIAQVRNALVERALSYPGVRFIAMLDDDEWPSPHWLRDLMHVQEHTRAAVVEGSIVFDGAQRWGAGFDGLSSMRRPTGPTSMLEGAGNILVTRDCLTALGAPWFDPAFALTGG